MKFNSIRRLIVVFCVLLSFGPYACAQSPVGKLTQTLPTRNQTSPIVGFKVSLSPANAKPGETVTLSIDTSVQDGWHIYPVHFGGETPSWYPTKIEFESAGLEAIDSTFNCSVEPKSAQLGEDTQLHHEGKFSWTRKFRVKEGIRSYSGSGAIAFQVCDETKCLPPKTLAFDLSTTNKSELQQAVDQYEWAGEAIQVELEKCKLTRPKVKISIASVLFSSGNPQDRLSLKGTLKLENGKSYTVYFPGSRIYTLENDGSGNTRLENSATYISIDHDGDGVISDWESHASNLPIRIDDQMYRVTELNKKEKKFAIRRVAAPLSGSIVGHRCPPFKLTSLDGETISDKSILGKVTILDIWAVT